MKVAVLILAHKNEPQLVRLIEHLKSSFHLYIHIDKRSDMSLAEYENDPAVHVSKKYNTYWGHENTVLALLFLYKRAHKKYDRYISISGQDLPLKTNKEILNFFRANPQTNFITSVPLTNNSPYPNKLNRVLKFHAVALSRLSTREKIILRPWVTLVKVFGFFFNRYRKADYAFEGGPSWMDLTESCLTNMLSYIENHPKYVRRFRYTRCVDEIFFQTLICGVLKEKKIKSVSRYINWCSGPEYPRTLTIENKHTLLQSEALFARKFDPKKDNKIIDLIYRLIA